MKRRQIMRYAGVGLLAAVGAGLSSSFASSLAQAGQSVTVQYFGHTCFLFTGGGVRVLVNPFRSLGCTAGYKPPKVASDLVLISSQLLDEGAVEILPGNPRLLYEPGSYQVNGRQIQGIRMDHDRLGGRRFGVNVAWRWRQGGLDILHLGGAAAPITTEQQILMGRPDLLLIPVGNGPKAYGPEEAKQALDVLQPKIIIPTHYLTKAAAKDACDLVPVDNFLTLMKGTPIQRAGSSITLSRALLPKTGSIIQVMNYA
jgi:L-ascorbate metabolism protein UlaG (beta-lactamase superfamily)